MESTVKTYFKFFIFLFGISLLLVNCEKDNFEETSKIEEQSTNGEIQVNRISLEQLKEKESLRNAIEKISKSLDVNKTKEKGEEVSKIDSNDGSFTILTDNIFQVTRDSIESYSFRIETPTSEESHFENFVIIKNDSLNYDFFIYKYKYTINEDNSFQYYLLKVAVDENQINLGNFSDYLNKGSYYVFADDCLMSYQEMLMSDGVTIYYLVHVVGCADDNEEDGNPSGNSGGSNNNTNNNDTNTNTSGTSTGGGGGIGASAGSSPLPVPVAVILSPSTIALNSVLNCLTNLNPVLGTYLYEQSQIPQSTVVFELNSYLQANNCSADAQSFGTLAVGAEMDSGEVDYNNRFFYFSWDEYPCQKSIVEDANSGNFGEIGQGMQLVFGDNSLFGNPDNVYVNYDVEGLGGPQAWTGITMTPVTGNLIEINITFDTNFIEESTDLGIFSVAIHENLHALLAIFLDLDIIDVNDPNTNLSSLANLYAERRAQYLIDNSSQWNATDSGLLEHNIISEHVNALKAEIKNYGESKGYAIDDFIYEALAWNGLTGTTNFLELPVDEQEYINDTIGYEIQNFTILSQGTPCN